MKFTSQTRQLLDQTRLIISLLTDHLLYVRKEQDTPMPGDPMALKQRYGSPAWLLFLSGYHASVSSQKREKKIRLRMQGGGSFSASSVEQLWKSGAL